MSIELSVVIPTFNRKDLLQEVLEALAQQTCVRDRYEIIVVSDGST
ncbi:MAG: glycosyltransferase family 2 protein, partial [Thermodesulfobacteriota bacterium]